MAGNRLGIWVLLCGVLWLVGGCVMPIPANLDQQPSSVGEVGQAEQAVASVEHARIAGNWAEVNRYLSSTVYSLEERNQTPSFPFAEVLRKQGNLRTFGFVMSVGAKDKVIVKVIEYYESTRMGLEFHMRREQGQWRVVGLDSSSR